MSTHLSIYTDHGRVPHIDDTSGLLMLDKGATLMPPVQQLDRAAWCREFAAVLIAEAEASEERHERQVRDLVEARAEVAQLRAEKRERDEKREEER